MRLQLVITDYVAPNPELFNGWTTDNQSVEEHVDKNEKDRLLGRSP